MQQIFDDKQLLVILGILAIVVLLVGSLVVSGIRKRKRRAVAIKKATHEVVSRAQPKTQPVDVAPQPIPTPIPTPEPVRVPTEEERVTRGLSRTKAFFQQALDKLVAGSQGEKFYEDIEEALLTADVGIEFAENVVTDLKKKWGLKIPVRSELKKALSEILISQLLKSSQEGVYNGVEQAKVIPLQNRPEAVSVQGHPHVIMIVGVNGAGKTTTIAKLCSRYQKNGKKVLVGAADTFRAAATEQLKTWVERVGAEGVFQKEGSDPSAVAFDSVQAAVSRKSDICIIDTAGRLHTKANLMEELKKMRRVIDKALPGAPHEVWLVVDGTFGQNALNQAREFHQNLGLTGIIVTKLDGSAKGGVVLAIYSELKIPVVYIGVGETPEDLIPFNAPHFVDAILEGVG